MQPANLRGLRVLVVDDHETNRRILRDILTLLADAADRGGRRHGRARRAAAGGAGGDLYDLVLLDAMMPELDGFAVAERIRREPETARLPVLMLTSGGQLGELARCKEVAIDGYLIKPMKQSDLLDAILTVLGDKVAELEAAPSPEPPEDVGRPLRVLLAEDHPVNQKLVTRLLERAGHTVHVAADGRAAVAALEREPFDLVLMDVQMPEMDGFEATAAIRARERESGGHTVIIAMTAHAMKGDCERCLAAGMDGYVAKPIDRRDLFEAIRRLAPGEPGAGEPSRAAPLQP